MEKLIHVGCGCVGVFNWNSGQLQVVRSIRVAHNYVYLRPFHCHSLQSFYETGRLLRKINIFPLSVRENV